MCGGACSHKELLTELETLEDILAHSDVMIMNNILYTIQVQ